MIERRLAILLLLAYGFVLSLAVATRADVLHVVRGADGHRRAYGDGQLKFDGAGPERWALRWRRQHRQVRTLQLALRMRVEQVVGLTFAFECVHRGEGSWSANTGNGYFGGLQMDRGFQSTYAPAVYRRLGTADHWSPSTQVAVAIVAHASRGFSPWPNTARACGLLP
jgi:hypothetical protein